jgi:spore maturation protein CgeB
MKAAAVMMQYDYGVKSRGHSYEYINVYLPLCKVLGTENVVLFDFFSEYREKGKQVMNRDLEEFMLSEKPDIAIFCLFTEELDENTLLRIKESVKTTAYFFDDPWRKKYADYWRKYFHYSTTPDYYAWQKYLSEGKENIVYSPFGFNEDIYRKMDLEKKYDVTFVGGFSPYRKWVIDSLKKKGINVEVFGRDWNSSWITQEDMVRIFNESRINLNLSNSISYDLRFLLKAVPSPKSLKQLLVLRKNKEQLKGRHYEINGCGGFQLSYFIPGLNLSYEIDKEIAVYEDIDNLPEEIKFFLSNNELRNKIADAGYMRSVKDHTAEEYISKLIEQIV